MHTIKKMSKLALGAFLFLKIFWNQPIVRHYKLNNSRNHNHNHKHNPIKIIFLSDLHNTIYGPKQKKLLDMIEKEVPDLILIGGDMTDERSDILGSKLLYEGIKDMCPTYFVTGNHEYWLDDLNEVTDMLKNNHIRRLDNASETLCLKDETIHLYGLNDPDASLHKPSRVAIEEGLKQATQGGLKEGYNILIAHRPEHIKLYSKYDFDLVLSGHAHGGQLRIPYLLNGLYAPNQGFIPKYAGGYYAINSKLNFIVGRGLSFKKKLPRIMNPPELIVITL